MESSVYLFDPSRLTRIEREDKILFFDPCKPAWLVTNAFGELVLPYCDGTRTHREIVDAFCAPYLALAPQLPDAVDAFLTHAAATGIFCEPTGPQTCEPTCHGPAHRPLLSQVQLSISAACNLRCTYCYATDRVEQTHPPLTLEGYQKLIDGLCHLNPRVAFTLTGGEPLLHPHCFEIAQYIVDKGCEVDLLTNGTLLTTENIAIVKRLFCRVTISADGSTPSLFERYRGAGTYALVERAVALLQAHQVPYRISMVVSRHNVHDVEAMAAKYGGHLNFQPLFKAGRAAQPATQEEGLSGEEYFLALKRAHGVNPLSYCEEALDGARREKHLKCALGDSEISISPTGDVYPCQLLHYPEFLAGNVQDQSIDSIYHHSKVLKECRCLTVDQVEGCATCFLRYVCGGACRARAYHECGSLKVAGPFCAYEREAFLDGLFQLYDHNALNP